MPKKSSKPKMKGHRGRQQPQKPAKFKYKPLQTSESIRLLQLKPGTEDEPIRCWLFEVRLDDWPLYQAVSYTWGDPDDKSIITCNENTVSVPRNLADGLRVLRRPDRLRILWADAVCINQKDPEERGSQVQLMGRIFSEASRVLIWLGHGHSLMIHAAFQYICGILNREQKDTFASYNWKGKEINVRDGGTDSSEIPPEESTLFALEHLFARPYFRRGWIIQEIVLPKTAEIFWDEACINYLWLEAATKDLRFYHSARFMHIARLGMGAVDQIRHFRYVLHDTPDQYPFAQILMDSNYQDFSDPRDYIYGLLGLQKICRDMTFKRPLINPDYTISHMECYKSAVEILLTEREDIGILSLVRHQRAIADDIPSWIPRLNSSMDTAISCFYYHWRASGRHRAILSKSKHDDRDCMRLRGFRVATLGTTILRGVRDPKDVQKLLRDLQDRYDERSIAWTVTYGESVYRQTLWQQPERQERHLENYRDFIRHDVGEAILPDDSSATTGMGDAFGQRCTESLRRYTLFEADEKYLGICLGPAQTGDQLVIFFGGKMPFVLRPVEGSDTCWRLVGVCFVHGMMEGEAIERLKHGVRQRAEDFDLI